MTYEEAKAEIDVRTEMLAGTVTYGPERPELRAAVMRYVRDEARKIVELAEAALAAMEAEP